MNGHKRNRLDGPAIYAGMVVASGLIWLTTWVLNKHLTSFSNVAPGINLVFLPAGFRLLLILLFGVWGAIGIFLFEPLLFFNEFGSGTAFQIMTSAAISGFSPLIAVIAFSRVAGIRPTMAGLRPIHLPLLALLVSLFTPLLFNLFFVAMGMHPASEFLRDYTAMAAGDFFGCVIVIGLIKVIFSRRSKAQLK